MEFKELVYAGLHSMYSIEVYTGEYKVSQTYEGNREAVCLNVVI